MSELVQIWLTELFTKEIEETRGAIQNEQIWLKGSNNEESILSHQMNIDSLEEYKGELMAYLNELN